jgi:nicotinamide-nucleotide amidase
MKRAAVMTIGDEILSGRVLDTNGAAIASRLRSLGFEVTYHLTCADSVEEIVRSLRFCAERADAVVTTGGLGPTEDDVTHEAVASFAGVGLELHGAILDQIRVRFESRGLHMPASNERSAKLPAGGEVIANDHGTAPGCALAVGDLLVVSLPGVPRELLPMLEEGVVPLLRARFELGGVTRIRVLKTFGLTESRLGMIVERLPRPTGTLHVGYRPTFPEIHLALTAAGRDDDDVARVLDEFEATLRTALPTQIWGGEGDSFASVIGAALAARQWRLATAESCTGGLVAKLVTDAAGSSGWFERGYTTYSNESKVALLGVPADVLAPDGPGAVSERCAAAMADGARRAAGVDVAISTTGVAGPSGGSLAKPVGTVWVGLATPTETTARAYRFPGERGWVRTLAAYAALERLRRLLLGLAEHEPFAAREDRR